MTNFKYFLKDKGLSSKIIIISGRLFVLWPASIEEQITFSFLSLRTVSSTNHYTMVSRVDGSLFVYAPTKMLANFYQIPTLELAPN
ncbi:hypothetical protein MUB24_22785, partial [Lederbergia sp. NSJ-179]|uniref:hypothetical protein n=1 Tax=Lederbergia sp. NSJ-179 TaxID=2931402 RepID=UPI001FD3DB59